PVEIYSGTWQSSATAKRAQYRRGNAPGSRDALLLVYWSFVRISGRKAKVLVFLFASAVKICECLCPGIDGHHVSCGSADQICSPEVDAPVSTGDTGLVCRIMKGPPVQRHGDRGCNARLDRGTSRDESNGSPEAFAASPQRQDRRARRAECAVT